MDVCVWNSEILYENLPQSGLSETRMATLIEFPMAAYVTQEMAFTFFWKKYWGNFKTTEVPSLPKEGFC